MAKRVVAAYQDRHDGCVVVLDDGAHMEWSQPDQGWVRLLPPLPPEALGEEVRRAADRDDDLTAAYLSGLHASAPTTHRRPASEPPGDDIDVLVYTPHGKVQGYRQPYGWCVYDEAGESREIAPADVLGWEPLPRAIVRDGRVVGVAHG